MFAVFSDLFSSVTDVFQRCFRSTLNYYKIVSKCDICTPAVDNKKNLKRVIIIKVVFSLFRKKLAAFLLLKIFYHG